MPLVIRRSLELCTIKMPEINFSNRSKPVKHVYSPNSTTISGRMNTKTEKLIDTAKIEEVTEVEEYIKQRKEELGISGDEV